MALALDQMDTTYLQGFHYAKPMPMEDFYTFMKSHEEASAEEEAAKEEADENSEMSGKVEAAAEDEAEEAEEADEASAEDIPLAASSVC